VNFVIQYSRVRIRRSALKHGETFDSIRHALRHHVVEAEFEDDPCKVLIVGPDRSGNLLEIIGIEEVAELLVIHAMRFRPTLAGIVGAGRN